MCEIIQTKGYSKILKESEIPTKRCLDKISLNINKDKNDKDRWKIENLKTKIAEVLEKKTKLQEEITDLRKTYTEAENLLNARQNVITNLELDNQQLREELIRVNVENTENLKKIDDMTLQLYDFQTIKRYAEFNKFAAKKLIGMENELNLLKEKNADLIHRNFCLTFEKNELYNLIKILEGKIYKSNCDIQRLMAAQAIVQDKQRMDPAMCYPVVTLAASRHISSNSSEQSVTILSPVDTKSAGYGSEKASLIRQVEFYKNKLFLTESNLEKKNKEIIDLNEKYINLVNRVETDQLDFQKRYDEIGSYHKNKVAELYELWKQDYTALERSKDVKDNELLALQEKYSKLENDFLQCQKEKRDLEDCKIKFQTLQIKYEAEKSKYSKHQKHKNTTYEKDLLNLHKELTHSNELKSSLEDKLLKKQALLNLEISKNDHLREKCRDYWTLLTAKDEQLKLAQKTVENQVIERQRLIRQIVFYKNLCLDQGVQVFDLDGDPEHELSLYKSSEFGSDSTPTLLSNADHAVKQLYKNATYPSTSTESNNQSKTRSKISILEQLSNIQNDTNVSTKQSNSKNVNKSRSKIIIDKGASNPVINAASKNTIDNNEGNIRDFIVAKKTSPTKRRSKKTVSTS